MRSVHWLFVVGMALFVGGIGFIIAGARMARRAPVSQPSPAVTPVASVKQIMKAIVDPAATAVFNSVSTIETINGIEEKAPRTDAEWEAVGDSAAALIESGNLMLAEGRRVDQGDWVAYSQAMIDSSKAALSATQAKNATALFAAGGTIYESCDNCHRKYQRVF
jgi:hypothetical protein